MDILGAITGILRCKNVLDNDTPHADLLDFTFLIQISKEYLEMPKIDTPLEDLLDLEVNFCSI